MGGGGSSNSITLYCVSLLAGVYVSLLGYGDMHMYSIVDN